MKSRWVASLLMGATLASCDHRPSREEPRAEIFSEIVRTGGASPIAHEEARLEILEWPAAPVRCIPEFRLRQPKHLLLGLPAPDRVDLANRRIVGRIDGDKGDLPKSPIACFVALARRREANIERIEAYAKEARFPANWLCRKGRVSIFVDQEGAACAMAHLLLLDRQEKIVRAIVETNIMVRIADGVSGDFLEWIGESGLTREECALIQPSYPWSGREVPVRDAERARLQKHFADVVGQLRRDGAGSLERSVRRLLKDARFAVLSPPPGVGSGLVRVECVSARGGGITAQFVSSTGLPVGKEMTRGLAGGGVTEMTTLDSSALLVAEWGKALGDGAFTLRWLER